MATKYETGKGKEKEHQMSQVICIKCGATGDSKCPRCRTVFPDNQMEAALSWNMVVGVMENREGKKFYCLGYRLDGRLDGDTGKLIYDIPEAEEEASYRLIEIITSSVAQGLTGSTNETFGMPTLQQLFCNHDFHYRPGGKCRYGCGYEEPLVDESRLEPYG